MENNIFDLANVSTIQNQKQAEQMFAYFKALIAIGLDYGFSDIIITEGEYPYMIDSSKNIYEFESKKEKGKIINFEEEYKKKVSVEKLSKFDVFDLFIYIQKFSVLENLTGKFLEQLGVDFAIRVNGTKLRCNLSFYKGRLLELVCRVIPSEEAKTLEQLGLITPTNTVYKNVLNNMEGLILVVGPTGSGKSTTLTAMIDEINRNDRKHIITLEDPVEYEHTNKNSRIVQREVGTDVRSYAEGMKFILRQKPHIVSVGETRTAEVMRILVELSMTWHLCLTTFHSKSVTQTISRMLTFYSEEERDGFLVDLAEILIAIFVQRLIPKKWGGKVLLKEVLITTEEIRRAIASKQYTRIHGFMASGISLGMITTDQALLELFKQDLITGETFSVYAVDKQFAEKYTGITY